MSDKIITFPANLSGHRSAVDGGIKLTFDVPDTAVPFILPLLASKDKNMFVTVETVATQEEYLARTHEEPAEKRKRYIAKVHALITDIAHEKKVPEESVKGFIKDKLKSEGKLSESLSELSVRELGEVISRLENVLHPITEDMK
jgi:signal transduction histidine kinase